jgi:hypothetical protein
VPYGTKLELQAVEGDGLQAVRYHRKTIAALAPEGRFLSRREFPQRLKPIEVVRVMYELKLVPFISLKTREGRGLCQIEDINRQVQRQGSPLTDRTT